jgi:hypothetical protein
MCTVLPSDSLIYSTVYIFEVKKAISEIGHKTLLLRKKDLLIFFQKFLELLIISLIG